MINLYIDLYPDYAPFPIQATKSDGTVIDPTNLTNAVNLYEEDGADGTFVNSVKAQYTPVKINGKTGFYGILIPKTQFVAGKFYMLRWAPTVDSISTAKAEVYFALNSASFKANISNLALEATLTAMKGAGWTDESLKAIKDVADAISAKTALEATLITIAGAGWTDETLKAIKEAVDAFTTENYNGSGR